MSSTAAFDAAARYVDAHAGTWRELLQSLIRYRSVFEAEHGIVDFVAARIAASGVAVTRVPHRSQRLASLPTAQRPFSEVPGRASLVARIPGSGSGRSLAFNVHLDIVPEGDEASWTYPPFAGHIDAADVIYGRGAMDDKAGVAIALAVLETLGESGMSVGGDVVFHFVLEDENTGNGSLLCLDAGHRADAVVIVDGTRPDRAIDRHAGQLQFDVQVTGRPASVSVSHLGVNAADVLARLVAHLADRVAALNVDRVAPWTQFPSPFQLITQRLAAQGAALTVPERADATCYVTFPPPWTLARMRDFLDGETRALATARGLSVPPVLVYRGFQAEPVAADSAAVAVALNTAAAGVGFGPITVGPSTGTSDLRHFVAAGIPGLLYGPGSGFNPHRPDERYNLLDLAPMVKLFVALILNWCGSAAPMRD